MTADPDFWIAQLGLQPHPEGGYYRETYRATELIPATALPSGYAGPRAASTAIYFLLRSGQVSRLHRLRATELWHFYSGSSLTIHCLHESGEYIPRQLGADLLRGEQWQVLVPGGVWFGATVDQPDSYVLVGCTVAPGFDFADFEMARRKPLLQQFPQHAALIRQLVPSETDPC